MVVDVTSTFAYLPIEEPTNEVIPRNNQQRHGDHETRDLTNHGEKRMPKGSAGERKLLRQNLSNAKRIYPDLPKQLSVLRDLTSTLHLSEQRCRRIALNHG
jgi:hypothetical protein